MAGIRAQRGIVTGRYRQDHVDKGIDKTFTNEDFANKDIKQDRNQDLGQDLGQDIGQDIRQESKRAQRALAIN